MGAAAHRRARDTLCWPFSADALVECYEGLFPAPLQGNPEAGRTITPPGRAMRHVEGYAGPRAAGRKETASERRVT